MSTRTTIGTRLIRRMFDKRFVMARMTRWPLLGPLMEYALFEDDDMMVLPRDDIAVGVKRIEMNAMAEPEEVVLPSEVVEHFVRNSRYIFRMNTCMCREANDCKDYPIDLGCLFLGRGVLRIDESLGEMISQEEALEHLRRCREAGLVHLIGRNKIDSVWLNAGPKEELLSLCNCCPCCCLWKMIPNLSTDISGMVTRMPGLEVIVDEERCTGCGQCERSGVCYVDAIKVVGGRARVDRGICKGCGRCVEICKNDAIELLMTDEFFIQSAINRLEPLVDIRKV
jgi:ferredoxin